MRHGIVRGTTALLLIGAVMVSMPPSASAMQREAQPLRKLSRGLANTVTGLLEIPLTISVVSQEEGPVAGMSWGLFLGTGAAITRTAVGLIEVLTFPFPLPATGYAPLLRPEFLLQPDSTRDFNSPRY
jgi:putative exosortase-associated protein (TIGR04073 family)